MSNVKKKKYNPAANLVTSVFELIVAIGVIVWYVVSKYQLVWWQLVLLIVGGAALIIFSLASIIKDFKAVKAQKEKSDE